MNGKQLIFGTKATCKDGVLEYMTSDDSVSVQPKCVGMSAISISYTWHRLTTADVTTANSNSNLEPNSSPSPKPNPSLNPNFNPNPNPKPNPNLNPNFIPNPNPSYIHRSQRFTLNFTLSHVTMLDL